MRNLTLTIDGMSCGHCLKAVNKELSSISGVELESVQLGRAQLRYDEQVATPDGIAERVTAIGYPTTPVSSQAG